MSSLLVVKFAKAKKLSRKFQDQFGHTPFSVEEEMPWKCRQLIVDSGDYGRLPVMREVERRKVKIALPADPKRSPRC